MIPTITYGPNGAEPGEENMEVPVVAKIYKSMMCGATLEDTHGVEPSDMKLGSQS